MTAALYRTVAACSLAALLLAAPGCEDEPQTEWKLCIENEFIYDGAETSGQLYLKEFVPGGYAGFSSLGQAPGVFELYAPDDTRGVTVCTTQGYPDTVEYQFVAWLDADGDAFDACSTEPSSDDCGPSADDPISIQVHRLPPGNHRLQHTLVDP